MMPPGDTPTEWLETDGLGGFASGTVGGPRTRRYHGLLLPATLPPSGRMMLVNGFDAWIETPQEKFWLTSQRYQPGELHPQPHHAVESFTAAPWPAWVLRLTDGTRIRHEIFACHGSPLTAVSWRLLEPHQGTALCVRPFLSGRDYHALHHENPAFRFTPEHRNGCLVWKPYEGVPEIIFCANAQYRHEPHWYRRFDYEQERHRGLDHVEDLAAPGILTWDLSTTEAAWLIGAGTDGQQAIPDPSAPLQSLTWLRTREQNRRASFASPLHRAADAYLVKRSTGRTIIAGYPWFTDWGRDTFIAMRGLCLATGRFDDARAILLEWSGAVSEGMLPNRFPDHGETPEYNAVDASLWYVVAVHEYLSAVETGRARIASDEQQRLEDAVQAILTGYHRGTRYGIHCDHDGLLAAGEPGVQLTWMDAKVGDWVVTPRIGKPVEVQALWLNALWSARRLSDRWAELYARGRRSFQSGFWDESRGFLCDVIDCDHQPGTVDVRFRPNQIFAVGGLPVTLIEGAAARTIVDAVEQRLWTPLGLRSLAPDDSDYVPHYRGGVRERDGAYHQGTVWPFLIGPFVEAWVRIRGNTAEVRREADTRFVEPLRRHLHQAGIGHVSEVADGAPPHAPGGCPFQAWSLGEWLRLTHLVLMEPATADSQKRLRSVARKRKASPPIGGKT